MTREELAGLLGAYSAFEVGLGEVSRHRYEGHYGGESGDGGEGAGEVHNVVDEGAQNDGGGDSTPSTFHGLVGADAGGEFALPNGFTDEVSTGVGGEDGYEGVEDPVPTLGEVPEKDEVSQGPSDQEGSETAPHYGANEAQGLMLFQVEDAEAEGDGCGGEHGEDYCIEEYDAYQENGG